MLDEPQDIADLEAEIEALRDEADRSRKLTIVAKLVIVAGAVMLLVLVMGIAASLGSVALFGSMSGPSARFASGFRIWRPDALN